MTGFFETTIICLDDGGWLIRIPDIAGRFSFLFDLMTLAGRPLYQRDFGFRPTLIQSHDHPMEVSNMDRSVSFPSVWCIDGTPASMIRFSCAAGSLEGQPPNSISRNPSPWASQRYRIRDLSGNSSRRVV